MSKLITNTIRHTGASSDSLTFNSDGHATVENNLTVDGTSTLTGDVTVTGALTASNFSGRNLIINGSMQINQRGTVTGVTASSYGGPDRWKAARADAPGVWQLSQVADGPAGFSHCLEHKVTTANSSLDAGDEACITYSFEGQDLTQVKKGTASAEQLTLSFWCKSSTTGTYIVEFYDTDNNRQCSKSFTISAATTWEKKELTFPADTTGAFTYDNNESLAVRIWYAAGTTWTSGTLNTTWAASSDANRAVGCTNLSATLNNYFRLTGVQLEVGDTATAFEYEPMVLTKAKCQRYYFKPAGDWTFSTSSNGGNDLRNITQGYFPTSMRAAPTHSFSDASGNTGKLYYHSTNVGNGGNYNLSTVYSAYNLDDFYLITSNYNGYDCGRYRESFDAEL